MSWLNIYSSLALCFECKAHFMSIGYAVIVARAIMLKRACAERILCVPIAYGLRTLFFMSIF